jgi:uncharacterized protein YceK
LKERVIYLIGLLALLPMASGCGTVVGMTLPKECLKKPHSSLPWFQPMDLDASTRAYIGARLDFALIKGAPATKDLVILIVVCPVWAVDMALSGVADTLLLPITKGEKSDVDSEKESSHEVPSR